MTHKGIIKLVDYWENIIRKEKYDGLKERRDTITKWTNLYGKWMKKCYIHICPETFVEDWEINPEPMRPPAKYDNIPRYDYRTQKNGKH